MHKQFTKKCTHQICRFYKLNIHTQQPGFFKNTFGKLTSHMPDLLVFTEKDVCAQYDTSSILNFILMSTI